MVDANDGMSVERAIAAAKAFKPNNILWFEEPTIPDDYRGYARIAEATGLPLAMGGEPAHAGHEFGYVFEQARLSDIQPDASNCGGISGWLESRGAGPAIRRDDLHARDAGTAREPAVGAAQRGAAGSCTASRSIEHTTRPLTLEDRMAIAPDEPGIGVTFDWDKLEPDEVHL